MAAPRRATQIPKVIETQLPEPKAGAILVSRPYIRGAERKKQIVDATLRLVAEHGVSGATLNRIASEVGMTTAGLYGHYPTRKAILVDALDSVFERVRELHRAATNPNALERLRDIGIGHTGMVSGPDAFATVFLEFIAAPPAEELREILGEKELVLVEDLVAIVRDGQRQGTIRSDVDPYQVGWTIVSRAWTEDISCLMGIATHWNEGRSERMLDWLLESIAVAPHGDLAAPLLE